MAGQGGRVEPNPKQTTSEPAAVGCFDGTHGRTTPNHPGGAKARGSREKKTGRGNRKGGRGNRGPGPAGGRDREPLGRGASDTPLPQLVASLPGINGASAYGPLKRVTPCRRKILSTSTSPRVRTARQPPQSAMGRPAAPPEERATDPRTNPHARPGKACIHAHSNPLRDRLCGTKLNRQPKRRNPIVLRPRRGPQGGVLSLRAAWRPEPLPLLLITTTNYYYY